MDYAVVCLVALFAAALTLFSGFGLGTILTPAFALFFPVPVAIAATAVVHLANNVFKLTLMGRQADRRAVLRFGLPAAIAALAGAEALALLSGMAPLATYTLGSAQHEITLVKLVVAVLIGFFALAELLPSFTRLAFDRTWLPLGGALSGFFGGLSGHQGALRSAFLVKCGLTKEAFIGTGVVCAVIVDVSRLPVYGWSFTGETGAPGLLLAAAAASAFAGSYAGSRLVRKVTLRGVQLTVAAALVLMSLAMGAGLV